MTIHQAFRPGPASPIFCLDDLDTSAREPRVYDFTLAAALGYQNVRNIRKLIKASRAELETHGELVCREDRTGGSGNLFPRGANAKAGRPGTAFYLNEAQALVICAVTRTPIAARVRGELIKVFLLYRHRRLRHLSRAESQALQAIVEHADVVMAPLAHAPSICVVGEDDEGRVPWLLAPLTHDILDALAEFDSDAADLEDGADDEPNADDEENGDREPSLAGCYYGSDIDAELDRADDEPSLGSLDQRFDQQGWAGGHDGDLELDDSDREPNGDEADADGDERDDNNDSGIGDFDGLQEQVGLFDAVRDGYTIWPRPQHRTYEEIRDDAASCREAAARLRAIVGRLTGADPTRSGLPPIH